MAKPTLNAQQRRLLSFIESVPDEDFHELIWRVIMIEGKNRSAKRFPISEVRDAVDVAARNKERAGAGEAR